MDIRFVEALNQLMVGSGISNNELARRIDVDPAQVGRWRKGRGRPRPENLVRAATVFGVDHKWLWSLAYPEGVPPSEESPLDPRLSAFIAEIESSWRAMDDTARDMAERGARALFHVPPIQRRRRVTDEPEGLGRSNVSSVRSNVPGRKYERQSIAIQRSKFGFMPA